MIKLTKDQEQSVRQWVAEGANLNDIQTRLNREFEVTVTYLDARLLILSLGLKLQEKKKDAPAELNTPAGPPPGQISGKAVESEVMPPPAPAGTGKVSVTMDQIAIPGTVASGKCVFSDGKIGSWYLDQMGRLGMKAPEPGYQPPAADIPVFQRELDLLLQKAGF